MKTVTRSVRELISQMEISADQTYSEAQHVFMSIAVDEKEVYTLLKKEHSEVVSRRRIPFQDRQIDDQKCISLSKWLTQKKRFSLLLQGKPGSGKTTFLETVYRYFKSRIFSKDVLYVKASRLRSVYMDDRRLYEQALNADFLFIDDLGSESEDCVCYLNHEYPLASAICSRYDRRKVTVISTNFTIDAIGKRYGQRVIERIFEDYAILKFDGESIRLQNR